MLLPGTIDKYEPKKGDEENHKFKWLKIENIPTLDWAWSCGKFAHKYTKSASLNEAREEKMSLLLLEALTPDEIYNKYYNTIDRNIFDAAIAADPTSYNQQGNIVKVGGYVKWILKLYQNGSWKPGDSVETKDLVSLINCPIFGFNSLDTFFNSTIKEESLPFLERYSFLISVNSNAVVALFTLLTTSSFKASILSDTFK